MESVPVVVEVFSGYLYKKGISGVLETEVDGMVTWIKRLFCRHKWEICRKCGPFACISGEQLYKVCAKCGKVEKWIFREYEGGGYK